MDSHKDSKITTITELTSAARETRGLIVYSARDIRRLTGTLLWGNVLFALLAVVVTAHRSTFIVVSAVFFAIQLFWSIATMRHPERHKRTFFLLVGYITAIGSLAWLVMSTSVVPAHAELMEVSYAIGLVALWLITPRLVDIEKDMVSRKRRRWYMWGTGSAAIVGVAAVLGQITSSLLSRFYDDRVQWYFLGSVALIVALALATVCFYNIEKFNRYPQFMRQVESSDP